MKVKSLAPFMFYKIRYNLIGLCPVIALFIGFFVVIAYISSESKSRMSSNEFLIGALSVCGGLFIFGIQRKADQARTACDLFEKFNQRYDELHDTLNQMRDCKQHDWSSEQIKALSNYFNLCAEEWVQHREGAIPAYVWDSWISGMAVFARNPDILKTWETELCNGSYYSFPLNKVIKHAGKFQNQ